MSVRESNFAHSRLQQHLSSDGRSIGLAVMPKGSSQDHYGYNTLRTASTDLSVSYEHPLAKPHNTPGREITIMGWSRTLDIFNSVSAWDGMD